MKKKFVLFVEWKTNENFKLFFLKKNFKKRLLFGITFFKKKKKEKKRKEKLTCTMIPKCFLFSQFFHALKSCVVEIDKLKENIEIIQQTEQQISNT